jgi:tetratricopeptide (TPR) repeat protein
VDFYTLELSLRRQAGDRYTADARLYPVPTRPIVGEPPLVEIDYVALRTHWLDVEAYGKALSAMLFHDPRLGAALSKARAVADSSGVPLQLCLNCDPGDAQLQAVCWETLRDPEHNEPLCTHQRVLVSRLLDTADMRALSPRRAQLRALVVVAAPNDLSQYGMADLDAGVELQRCLRELDGLPARTLGGASGPASLGRLIAALQDGPDILYLVAHGFWRGDEVYLALEREDRRMDHVASAELTGHIAGLARRPRMVVLASCHSADVTNGPWTSAGLGPRLAAAGITGVLAMQGPISVPTVARAMPEFFRELRRDGQANRALAAARAAVRDEPDWWSPALFLRAHEGRLWPGQPERPLPFPAADSVETLLVAAPFVGAGSATVDVGIERAIVDALRPLAALMRPGGRPLRVEALPPDTQHPISSPHQARLLGQRAGAAAVIWGELDALRGRAHIELLADVGEVAPALEGAWHSRGAAGVADEAALNDELAGQGSLLVHVALAMIALTAGRVGEALDLLDAALAEMPDDNDARLALAWRGYARLLREQPELAYTDLDRALSPPGDVREARAFARRPETILARAWRGSAALLAGRHAVALDDLTAAVAQLPQWNRCRAQALCDLGQALAQAGALDTALARYREARVAAEDPRTRAMASICIGAALAGRGGPGDQAAMRHCEQGLAEARAAGLTSVAHEAQLQIGRLLRARGDVAAALDCFEQVRADRSLPGPRLTVAWAALRAGAIYLDRDDPTTARARFAQAEAIFGQVGSRYGRARALEAQALLALHAGDQRACCAALTEAAATLTALGSPDAAATTAALRRLCP